MARADGSRGVTERAHLLRFLRQSLALRNADDLIFRAEMRRDAREAIGALREAGK